MNIKLVALDLDGTILGDKPVITPAVMAQLRRVQGLGVQLAVVTGRMHRAAVPYHQIVQSNLPLLSYQGALIQDPVSQKIYQHQRLPLHQALDALRVLQSYGVPLHAYVEDLLYIQAPFRPENADYVQRTGVSYVVLEDLADALITAPTKLLAFWQSGLAAAWGDLSRRYAPDEVHLTRSTSQFIEVTHPLTNKGNALAYLAETVLGLNREEVFAIGDYYNDLEMIRYAGVGVAMGSAPDPVKAAADWVAPTVAEDGVAAALERFV